MQFISKQELQEKLTSNDRGFFLVDTREAEEYDSGHLPGALLIPWHMIDEHIKGIKKDKELILYCQTNNRATRAAGTLEGLGYTKVSVYRGGWQEWEQQR